MTIKQQKEKMFAYTDFFGGNLLDFSKIKKAKTKRELKQILDDHHHFLEMQITDAKRDLDKLIKEIKLTELDI